MIVELSRNKQAFLIIIERKAFEQTDLEIVAVKSAPWLDGEKRFGYVRPSEYRAGPFSVHLLDGGTQQYATLDAMLREWIGD